MYLRGDMKLIIKINHNYLHFLEFSDYRDSGARTGREIILFEYSSTGVKFPIEVVVEEMKTLVSEKDDFQSELNQFS